MRRSVIVGTGFIGTVHARAVRRAGGELVGVVGRSDESAARVAQAWGVPVSAGDVGRVLDEVRADVVHICTPNAVHAEQVAAAVERGCAVICEKPLGIDTAQAQAMFDVVRAGGVVHAVPFAYRFYAAVRELRARLAGGAAGRLTLLHGGYLQDWLADPAQTNWRADPAAGGPSRTFADIGIHWCDLAEFTTGDRIAAVCANTSSVHDRGGTEDLAAVLFRTAGGATGSMAVSQVSWGRKNRLELFVDTERAAFGFEQESPDRLWVGTAEGSRTDARGAGFHSPDAQRLDRVPAGHPQGYQDCFDAFVDDVYAALDGAAPDGLPTFVDGVRAAQITDAVLASARANAWVDVPSTT